MDSAFLSSLAVVNGRLAEKLESALTLWPETDRKILATAVAAAADKQQQPFASFDADGTLYPLMPRNPSSPSWKPRAF